MKKFNLSRIMSKAWELFRKLGISFSECLHRAWESAKAQEVNAARIAAAKAAAGISEETHTWSGWKRLGYEVTHGSKALYQTIINDPATKSGTRKTSYFGKSQVQPIMA